jgi:hypothetical protein
VNGAPAGRGRLDHWPDALRRGLVALAAVAAVGQAFALGAWLLLDTGVSLGAAAATGWLYVGAFHHIAIRFGASSVDLPGDSTGAFAISVGVAFLAVTAMAAWLLFRAGRAVADRAGGSIGARVARGASVAVGYAVPAFALSLLVDVSTPFRIGDFAAGRLHASLSPWQAVVLPLAIGAAAGGAGGLRSAIGSETHGPSARIGAATAGGWRAFALAIGLSIGGLFVAGVVRPDGIVALALPTTARYVDAVFDRPLRGTILLGHHLVVLPNEAIWTLVPAMGACDRFRTDDRVYPLCYGRFPRSMSLAVPGVTDASAGPFGSVVVDVGRAPAWTFGFLLVPVAATVLGGRLAASRRGVAGLAGARVGMLAGVTFAALVAAGAILSVASVAVDATIDDVRSTTRLVAGPDLVGSGVGALAWGLAGGAAGGATAGRFVRRRPSAPRPAPR